MGYVEFWETWNWGLDLEVLGEDNARGLVGNRTTHRTLVAQRCLIREVISYAPLCSMAKGVSFISVQL
jgi:hypothetical protein